MRLRELMAKPEVGPQQRVSLYISTIAFQWLAAGVAAWRAWAHGFSARQLGLVSDRVFVVGASALLGAAVLASLQWINLRRMGRMSETMRGRLQALAQRILPQSSGERIPFFALAITAGICEEFLYRGFAMAAISRAGLPSWSTVVLSSVLFGLAHLYQGRGGLLGTMILGLLFGVTRITLGNLLPVVVWHIAIDVVAGIAGARYLIHGARVTGELQN